MENCLLQSSRSELLTTPAFFPPGDMTWKESRTQSHWREFNFMLNQVKRAVEPALALEMAISEWPRIACGLAEPPRKRKGQLTTK